MRAERWQAKRIVVMWARMKMEERIRNPLICVKVRGAHNMESSEDLVLEVHTVGDFAFRQILAMLCLRGLWTGRLSRKSCLKGVTRGFIKC